MRNLAEDEVLVNGKGQLINSKETQENTNAVVPKFVSSQNAYVEILMLNVMVSGGGCLLQVLRL